MVLSGAALLIAVPTGIYLGLFASPSVVIVIRHAERDPGTDPPLNAAGQVRAQALAHVAGVAGVTAIYATEFQRTQQTVAPLAAARSLTPVLWPHADVTGLVRDIRANHRGAVVLVCAHSETVHAIVNALAGTAEPAIGGTQFDHFYVVVIPRSGWARAVHLRYGAPTS
jgi:broad specificity phosphatase PhoE